MTLGAPAMNSTARLFFALWPTPALAGQLAGLAGRLTARHGGRPTREATIHLTLAFLGDVPEGRIPELCALADGVAVPRFTVMIDRLGSWPKLRLAWAGCRETPVPLTDLQRILRSTVEKGGFRCQGPAEPVPHVTLVRKLPASVFPLPEEEIPALSWPVPAFRLVRSQLSAAGPDYACLAEFPLI